MTNANEIRGEALLALPGGAVRMRPSFSALVAAETELGPLFALVERAATGVLLLAEMAALLWHCRVAADWPADRDSFSEALVAGGLAEATPTLRIVLGQILAGR